MTKDQIIEELKRLHKEQRAWQRLVNDEQLDIEYLKSLTLEQLQMILKSVQK